MGVAAAVAAPAVLLAGCAGTAPDPVPSPEAEPAPAFDGVIGQDWVEHEGAGEALDHVYAVWSGFGALWALRDNGPDATDTLLRSENAADWHEVELDPRMPGDISDQAQWYADDEQLLVAFSHYTAQFTVSPWLARYDGAEWSFHGPEDFGRPSPSGSLTLHTDSVQAVAPVGDSVLLLVGASWYDGGSSTIGCACNAPLVLHADGSAEWIAVQGGPLGRLDTFGGLDRLIPVDDGVLLVTSWLDGTSGFDARIHVLHSIDGLTWTERTGPSTTEAPVGELTEVVRSGGNWVTATLLRDRTARTEHVVLLHSSDGMDWTVAYRSEADQYRDIHTVIATETGFYAFPVSPLTDQNGSDVLFSADGRDWAVYSDAVTTPWGDTPEVLAATEVDGGLLVHTNERKDPLYLSGATP